MDRPRGLGKLCADVVGVGFDLALERANRLAEGAALVVGGGRRRLSLAAASARLPRAAPTTAGAMIALATWVEPQTGQATSPRRAC
jgi:hypothetical protein